MRIRDHIKSDDAIQQKLEKIVNDPDFKLLLTLAIAQVSQKNCNLCDGAWAMHDAILSSMRPVKDSESTTFGLEYQP